jgi:hypothetical protein
VSPSTYPTDPAAPRTISAHISRGDIQILRRSGRSITSGGPRDVVDQRLGGEPARPGRPHAMAELLETGAALQQAQQDSLAGQPGAARQLRSTSAQLRAETLLIRAGHAASATLVDTPPVST